MKTYCELVLGKRREETKDNEDDWTDYEDKDHSTIFVKKGLKTLLEYIGDNNAGIKEGVYLELCNRIKVLYESCK